MKGRSYHKAEIFFKQVSARPVTFIDDKNICDLHYPCLHGLYLVATFRDHDDNSSISNARNFNFTLANPYGLNNDLIKPN